MDGWMTDGRTGKVEEIQQIHKETEQDRQTDNCLVCEDPTHTHTNIPYIKTITSLDLTANNLSGSFDFTSIPHSHPQFYPDSQALKKTKQKLLNQGEKL